MIVSFKHSLGLTLLANLLLLVTSLHNPMHVNDRETLEIIIGGGGGGGGNNDPPPNSRNCPPPPAPPQPYPFESKRIEIVYPVIQRFKQKITYDPYGVTKTWTGPDICNSYKGFVCDVLLDYNETSLAGVDFNGFNFDGPTLDLGGFIDELPDITVFHANSNGFKGALPSKITELKYFYELDLSNNKYSGVLPYQVLGALKLTFLDLRFNQFYGMAPPQLFKLDVDVLFINNNNFMKELPEDLGLTPALYLTLANNNFTGPIPKSIGQAGKTLIEILLLKNQLTGCLPCEIGLLEKARVFDASYNFLTGPIPLSFACMGQMSILNLAHNQLYGPVPELVCELANLSNLSLSYNYFTRVGPSCLKLIQRKVLDVTMNCIPGLPAQRPPAQCRAYSSKAMPSADQRSSNWIPCDVSSRRKTMETSQYPNHRSTSESKRALSYDALDPRRL